MTEQDLLKLIADNHGRETEILEFKEAKNQYSVLGGENKSKNCIYGYCVGIGNMGGGKLLLGAKNDGTIVGTKTELPSNIKTQIYNLTQQHIEIDRIDTSHGKVVIISIPGRHTGQYFEFYGVPLMRKDDGLIPMDQQTIKKILNETNEDRSAKVCAGATINDLDPQAIKKARASYLIKNANKSEEINKRDDSTFLNKSKITIQGKITNTAILLLGRTESGHFLSPAIAKISRILKDRDGKEVDYQHFNCPLLLATEEVYKKIRNLKYRYIADTTLFPEEVDKYDPYIIREALNNCIAHQDYLLAGKINVVENEDSLVFTNRGSFIPKTVQNVIDSDAPSEYYRNRFLVDAMVNLNMIDTIGSGIKKMFLAQKKRFFPLPEYEISDDRVVLTIIGRVIDLNYARKLAQIPDLSLHDIILLDRIQKKKSLSKEEFALLKKKKLVEGSMLHHHISLGIAQQANLVEEYILLQKNIEEQRDKIVKLIIGYKQKGIEKNKIMKFVLDNKIFEEGLSSKQQDKRLQNILTYLKDQGVIYPVGAGKKRTWYSK